MFQVMTLTNNATKTLRYDVDTINEAKSVACGVDKADIVSIWSKKDDSMILRVRATGNKWFPGLDQPKNNALLTRFKKSSYAK